MKSNYRFILACAIPLFLLGPNNVVSAEKSSQQYLAEGNQFLTSGQFNDAVISYDAAIQQDPDDYLSYFKRATAYLSLGKTNLAIEDFTKILNLKPGFSRALLQRAKLYLGDGEFTLAKHDLEDYQKISPSDDAAQLLESVDHARKEIKIAETAFESRKYEDCVQHITEVIRIAPQKPQWRTLRAKCNIGRGEIEEAAGDLTRVANLNPSDQDPLMDLARLNYYSLYEPERALSQVKQCLHYDPEQKQCKALFRQIKRFEKELAKIIDSKDKQRFATALNSLIGTNIKTGLVSELDEPFANLESIYDAAGRLPKKLHLRCYELACSMAAEQKDTNKAEKWCSATLELSPDHEEALASRGEMKLNDNDFEGAVRDLEKAFQASGEQNHRIRQLLRKAQQLLRQSKKRDYYKILDISRDADSRTIKKAYRKQAQQWHPDKYNGELTGEQVESKMADINQAYEVLSDPEKREQFDNGFDPYDPEAGQQQNPFGGGGGGHPFAHFGGGGFPFGGGGQQFSFHF